MAVSVWMSLGGEVGSENGRRGEACVRGHHDKKDEAQDGRISYLASMQLYVVAVRSGCDGAERCGGRGPSRRRGEEGNELEAEKHGKSKPRTPLWYCLCVVTVLVD